MTRFFDFIFAFTALLVLSPLMGLISVILKFTGEGEVIFRQKRVGKGGEQFELLKYATMLKDSPNMGTGVLTVKNDPRILPFGRILRKSKLNELPQLFNVLIGDMSLIGPRPQAPPHFDVFEAKVQEVLKSVRPGLSGIGSIVFRDEEKILESSAKKEWFYANVISTYKGEIECWYIKNKSLHMYFALMLLTVWVIIFPNSKLYRRVFRTLPTPPTDLSNL